jgi:DNA-binding response OmpR family regulator
LDVPVRILFADDSSTAQTMGIKILTEAGYEVVAVSNGSAALKKIAEQKPDIAILDVWMPGYSGLEICEKMRNSIDTLNTPVLLTHGKMEAFRNEDTNRVKADGVIVKPFEASALVAIIRKLEERILHPLQPPVAERTLYLERPTLLTDQFPREDFPVAAGQTEASNETGSHPAARSNSELEIPDHMASAPVFSDLPGHDFSVQHAVSPTPDNAVAEQPAPEPAEISDSVPLNAWKWEPELPAEPIAAAPSEVSSGEASPRETQIMPAYIEPEAGRQLDAVLNAAPEEAAVSLHAAEPATDGEVAGHPVIENVPLESPLESPPVILYEEVTVAEPELSVDDDPTKQPDFGTLTNHHGEPLIVNDAPQSEPEIQAATLETVPLAEPLVAEPEVVEVSAEDFAARVDAAMTAYDQPLPSTEEPSSSQVEAPAEETSHQVVAAEPVPENPAPPAQPADALAESELQTYGDAVSAYSATEITASAVAASGNAADPELIAQVVNRVMERLKPQLIAEIVRELNSHK